MYGRRVTHTHVLRKITAFIVVSLGAVFLLPRFALAVGTITGVSPQAISSSSGTSVTTTGSGFGSSQVYDKLYFGNQEIYSFIYIDSWSDTQIVARTPSYISLQTSPMQVSILDFETASLIKGGWLYFAPSISSFVVPSEIYSDIASIGSIVTVKGKNFTSILGKVLFGGVEGKIQSWTDSEIKGVVPVGATDGKITVKVYNQNSSDYSISAESEKTLYIFPSISNDPLASDNQLWLSQIKANEVWSETIGSPNIVVAVIDSGVDTNHIELTNNIWTNADETPGNGKDDDNNGFIDDTHGWDFVYNVNELSPYKSHGTHVAGIIAAAGNNNAGVAGIAWSTKIMPLIVCGSSGCPLSKTIDAIKYAVDNGANVINLSLGGTGWTNDYTSAYDEAIKYAYARNVVVVAAAGNGDYTGTQPRNLNVNPNSPVCNDGGNNMVIGVAATNVVDLKASFSDYGSNCIDISAPGEDIFSTVRPVDDSLYTGSYDPKYIGYDKKSGTSMAAPMVSGLATLLRAKYPNANAAQ